MAALRRWRWMAGAGRHEEIADGRESFGKSLECRPGSKSLHLPRALSKRDMRVLRSIVRCLVGAMFDIRHDRLPSGGVRAEFVGDDALEAAALLLAKSRKRLAASGGQRRRLLIGGSLIPLRSGRITCARVDLTSPGRLSVPREFHHPRRTAPSSFAQSGDQRSDFDRHIPGRRSGPHPNPPVVTAWIASMILVLAVS